MDQSISRRISILNKFLERLDVYGVCGFWVDSEKNLNGESISVYLVIDKDFLRNSSARPDHIVLGMKQKVKNKIKDYLGFEDIYLGAAIKECE